MPTVLSKGFLPTSSCLTVVTEHTHLEYFSDGSPPPTAGMTEKTGWIPSPAKWPQEAGSTTCGNDERRRWPCAPTSVMPVSSFVIPACFWRESISSSVRMDPRRPLAGMTEKTRWITSPLPRTSGNRMNHLGDDNRENPAIPQTLP